MLEKTKNNHYLALYHALIHGGFEGMTIIRLTWNSNDRTRWLGWWNSNDIMDDIAEVDL